MKRLAFICFFGALALGLFGQQDPKFTQSMFMNPFFNPGAVGSSDKICVLANFRNQWSGLPGAPTYFTFSAHMPFSLFGLDHGVGINAMSDNLAFSENFHFNASYAYRMDLGNGKLGIGINLGMINQNLDGSQWVEADGVGSSGDNAIPSSGGSAFAFDLGAGIYYNTDKMYLGLSTTHLNEGEFSFPSDNEKTNMIRHFYLMAGYNIQLSNPMFEVLPALLVSTDLAAHHIYLNTNIRYNKKFWGGVSYAVGGDLAILFGVEFLDGLRIGYSYDIALSSMMKHSTGSHEITVRYCFDLSVDKSPSRYKSIRFL